jgi:hypothetical protein
MLGVCGFDNHRALGTLNAMEDCNMEAESCCCMMLTPSPGREL